MALNDEKYFNVPIQVYEGFLLDSTTVLNNVSHYACYDYMERTGATFSQAATYFNIQFSNVIKSESSGKKLYDSIPKKSPKVGLRLTMYWSFYKDDKTEFEKVCLLGFLAIKSLLQSKAYDKLDNKRWLSRMDGKAKPLEFPLLSEPIRKYANEYQTKKIKNELKTNWGLVTYSYYTRGFYVSYKLTLNELVFEAVKKSNSVKEKQWKEAEKEARKKAIEQLDF